MMSVYWVMLICSVIVAFILHRRPLAQSVIIAVSVFLSGAAIAIPEKKQRDSLILKDVQYAQYRGLLVSELSEKPKTMSVRVMLTESRREITAYIYKDQRSRSLTAGDGIIFQAKIEDGRAFVKTSQWQSYEFQKTELTRIQRSRVFFLKLRHRLLQRFRQHGIEGETYSIVAAMSLGDKSALNKDLRQIYNASGAAHILALSGLHIGIIYAILSVMSFGYRWQTLSQIIIISSIWAFVFLVGLPTSAIRSAIMLTLYSVMSLGYREKMSLNTLAFSAFVMLIASPSSLFDVGFQLSYLSVLSIMVLMPVIDGWCPKVLSRPLFRKGWSMMMVTIAAQVGTAPLIIHYFGYFSVYSLFSNIVAIPAAILILYLSIATLITSVFAAPLTAIVHFLNSCLEVTARLPSPDITPTNLSVLQVVLFYALVLITYWIVMILSPSERLQG